MNYVSFSPDDKIRFFDELADHYYKSNFGQMSKSEIDLLMFHFYMEKLVSENRAEDGTIIYNQCSDYKISRDLGITQQRVRNLKIKNQLVHPIEYDWMLALAGLIRKAKYDKVTGKITLNIPDPNLYLEIQNFLEEQGSYVEKQLNSKILQLRVEYYIDLVVNLEPEESRRKIIKKIKKQLQKECKNDVDLESVGIGKTLINTSANIKSIVEPLVEMLSPTNAIGSALFHLLSSMI